jgi:hypothetical protein
VALFPFCIERVKFPLPRLTLPKLNAALSVKLVLALLEEVAVKLAILFPVFVRVVFPLVEVTLIFFAVRDVATT